MTKIHIYDHPLIQHKITLARKTETGTREFRQLVDEISMLMTYEITRDLPLEEIEINTPIGASRHKQIAGKKLGIVPIMRAGLGMVNGMLNIIPTAKVGHIGVYRDHDTLQAVEYFVKLPSDIEDREFIVVDPMLATGVSAISAITAIKNRGAQSIKFMCLIAAPEGTTALHEAHPDVEIYVASMDQKLNNDSYIVPGLGDAGDRLFGTK